MNIVSCRACGAPIGFVKTIAGKTVPVDEKSVSFLPDPNGKELFVMIDGSTQRGARVEKETDSTHVGFISHFATCPEADKFRKARKSDRKKG